MWERGSAAQFVARAAFEVIIAIVFVCVDEETISSAALCAARAVAVRFSIFKALWCVLSQPSAKDSFSGTSR